MKQTSKTVVFRLFFVIFILGLCHIQGNARFIANHSEIGFVESGRTGIRQDVVEAAGGFLKSHSDFLLILNKIEMEEINGIDYAELQHIIYNAVIHMEVARAKYNGLIQLVEDTPYHQPTITVLMGFDYASFQESKGLRNVIFDEVKTYLSSGDVRGLYHQLLVNTQSILDQLTVIKSFVDAGVIPENADLWKLNQAYSETLIFGQYAAEIFYDVTGK
jgi:hypothetical protein